MEFIPNTAYKTAKIKFENSTYLIKSVPNDSENRKIFVASSREFIGQCCRLTETDRIILVKNNADEIIGVASYKLARTKESETDVKKSEQTLFLNSEKYHILRYILLKNCYRKTKKLGKNLLKFIEVQMKIGVGGRNFGIRLECVPRAVNFFERNNFKAVGNIRHGTTFCQNKDGYTPDNYFKDLQFMEKSKDFQSAKFLID